MIDTTEKYALELSIQEFNDWCSKNIASHNPKYTLAELKGIFFNKLIKNLKGTMLIGANYWDAKKYTTELISIFQVEDSKITKLEFGYNGRWGVHDEVTKKNITILNDLVNKIDFKIALGVIPNFADKINQFKIK